MLKIRTYRDYWNKFRDSIDELEAITLVHSEGQLSKKISSLRNKRFILAVVMPSADIESRDPDSLKYSYEGIIYILAPTVNSELNEDTFIDNFDKTGDITQEIIETLNNDCCSGCHIFNELDFGSIKIDPEVNFMQCDGYSVSFRFKYPFNS